MRRSGAAHAEFVWVGEEAVVVGGCGAVVGRGANERGAEVCAAHGIGVLNVRGRGLVGGDEFTSRVVGGMIGSLG